MTPVAFLDASVLYPSTIRSVLMFLATFDAFPAQWSEDIHRDRTFPHRGAGIVIVEPAQFGEVLGGFRMSPTTARCGIYSYMLRDAQRGLLDEIPSDVLFFEAPVSKSIWEASRLFISQGVPAHRRLAVQSTIMETLSKSALELGASPVIGIVPAVWSRWLRRLDLDAVPVGPKFSIDGTLSQAALFNTSRLHI